MKRIRRAWRSLGRDRAFASIVLIALTAIQAVLCVLSRNSALLPIVIMVGLIGLILLKLSAATRDASSATQRAAVAATQQEAESTRLVQEHIADTARSQRATALALRQLGTQLSRAEAELGRLTDTIASGTANAKHIARAVQRQEEHSEALAGIREGVTHLMGEASGAAESLRVVDRRLARAFDGGDSSSLERRLISEMSALLLLRGSGDRPLLPPFEGWSMSPLTVRYIQEVASRLDSTATVVELGSGVSTAWTAFALSTDESAPRFVAVDHDPVYAAATRRHLEALEISSRVELILAPLAPVQVDGVECAWYDTEWIASVRDIGLLIVDGPPAGNDRSARHPALPLLVDRLADQATILVDDANRAGESEMVRSWLETPGVRREGFVGRSLILNYSRRDGLRN